MWELKLENWVEANPKILIKIHDKGNQLLDYTIVLDEKISNRAFTLISILVPILYLVLGLILRFAFYDMEIEDRPILWISIVVCLINGICLGYLIWIVFPKSFMHPGREPKASSNINFIQSEKFSPDEQEIGFLINEIQNLQFKIEHNESINRKRLRYLKAMIWVIAVTVFLTVSCLLIYVLNLTSS